jgi:hypothetical protein
MSSSLYRHNRLETNPFQIYGTGNARPLRAPSFQPQSFPGQLPRRRPAMVKEAAVSYFSAPLQWQEEKRKINPGIAWFLVLGLLAAIFSLMIAPQILDLSKWQANHSTVILNPPHIPLSTSVRSNIRIKTRTVRTVTKEPVIALWSPPSKQPSPNHLFSSAPLLYGVLSSPFGHRWHRRHQGVDLAAPLGTPVYAVSDGRVLFSGWMGGYGKSLLIDHGQGIQTRYAHCSRLLTHRGQRVHAGQTIARVGSTGQSTGPHLHFEVLVNGLRRNPGRYFRLTPPFIPWGSSSTTLAKAKAAGKQQAAATLQDESLLSLWQKAYF